MGASPTRLQPPRRGLPPLPSLASLVAMAVATLGTGCEPQQQPAPTSSPTATPTSTLGTVSATSRPPSDPSQPASQRPRTFDHTAVQDAVYSLLARTYQIENVQLVICPPNRPVVRGTTFRCTAKIAGDTKSVPIRVTSDDGDYEVGRPE